MVDYPYPAILDQELQFLAYPIESCKHQDRQDLIADSQPQSIPKVPRKTNQGPLILDFRFWTVDCGLWIADVAV